MSGSTFSQESLSKISKWRVVQINNKVGFFKSKIKKEKKIKFDTSILNDYVSLPQNDDVDLIHKLKLKV